MRSSRLLNVFAAAVLPFLSLATAQESKPEPKPESKVEIEACNGSFARSLVDQQVADSRGVVETGKRVKILIRSADFLWKLDQPTARDYFTDAFNVATAHFAEKGFERKTEKALTTMTPDYRFDVIRAIAKKDAAWAKKLTERLMNEYEKSAPERKDEFDRQREISSVIFMAQENVKTNPELSWYLFRSIMRYPLDSHWYFSLFSVAESDRKFADALYSELLANYSNATPRRFLFLSPYPFGNPRVFGLDKFSYGSSIPASFEPNVVLQQRFIDAFLRRIAAFTSDPENLNRPAEKYYRPEPLYILTALQEIEPIILERFPQLLQRFSAAKAQANAAMNDEMRKSFSDQEKNNERLSFNFDQRLELVEKADEEGKLTDFMIVQLIIWGEQSKTEEQYKKIEPWLDKIKDETVRVDTTSYFWFLRSKLAVKEKRFDDAGRYAQRVNEPDHRALLSFDIAEMQLKDMNEAAAVYQTLNDVGRVARQSENSVAKARIFLGLASLYEKFNHTFALDELSDAVKVINRLENPDILSSTIRRQINGNSFGFYTSASMPGYDLEATFRSLSKDDFDMTLSNARALEDKYFRTLAVLAVAQNCIDRPKPKAPAKGVKTN